MEKLTKQQFRDRFTNIKVYVDGKSKELQKQFFKAGFARENDINRVVDSEEPFMFTGINSQEEFVIYEDSGMTYFSEHENHEVKADEILNIKIVEDEPE